MIMTQILKFKTACSLAAVLVLLGSGMCLCKAQDRKSTLGELKIEGKYIERLVLSRNDGHREVLNNPGETVKLPVGQYLLQDVRLKGGYTRQSTRAPHSNRITISEDYPTSIKVGGPLKQTVSVRRQGRTLELAYSLAGVGGGTYAAVKTAGKGPAFVVYKGDREIGTGEFEFG